MSSRRYCQITECEGRVTGRAPDLFPFCSSCRWRMTMALLVSGIVVGMLASVLNRL